MKPVIYIDVLFFVNFFVNFILLAATAGLAGVQAKKPLIIAASGLGALYASFMFFPALSFIYTAFAKLLSSMAIVAIAYNIRGIRLYFKALGIFYLVTLCFGGGIFALFTFTGLGAATGAVVKNGILYINLPWQLLFIAVCILYFFITRVFKMLVSRKGGVNLIDINITLNGASVPLKAIIDTGNALYDPISHTPVIVAEYGFLKPILPSEITEAFTDENKIFSYDNSESALNAGLRLIPFCSVGKENGILLGFKPDLVAYTKNEQTYSTESVIVALCPTPLSKDKSFQALMHPDIIS